MKAVNRSAFIQFSPKQMYDLVNDIERYPEFLPWCDRAEIISSNEQEMRATVGIAFKGLSNSFTTNNRLMPNQRIDLSLVDGPFKHLSGYWLFEDKQEQGTKISLFLKFDFSNFLVAKILGPVFSMIADTMVSSFCKRAEQIYRS